MTITSVYVNPSVRISSRIPSSAAELRALQDAISPARLHTYLRQTHSNARRALQLYEWNVRASAALVPILQVNEVALRNAVNVALISAFGANWPFNAGFLRSLPAQDQSSFLADRSRLQRRIGVGKVTVGDVVAAHTYWFWVRMLAGRYQSRVWNKGFALAFPHAPTGVDREVVYSRAEAIRVLRNRIAHHEPLLNIDLPGAYQRALSIARWISPIYAEWATERWPLGPELTSRP